MTWFIALLAVIAVSVVAIAQRGHPVRAALINVGICVWAYGIVLAASEKALSPWMVLFDPFAALYLVLEHLWKLAGLP